MLSFETTIFLADKEKLQLFRSSIEIAELFEVAELE